MLHQALLELALRMHIDDDGEAVVENHLHRGVEIAQIIRGDAIGLLAPEHRLRIHTQPYMVESHVLD